MRLIFPSGMYRVNATTQARRKSRKTIATNGLTNIAIAQFIATF